MAMMLVAMEDASASHINNIPCIIHTLPFLPLYDAKNTIYLCRDVLLIISMCNRVPHSILIDDFFMNEWTIIMSKIVFVKWYSGLQN